ncbi:hypothetical protein GCM10010124_01960 [Pilimelia terevasa]|uniref:Helix-turn-helix domain-containing protein n=1 Tax=Pilimelia terevasa TaxID=53372 RepID=A0A8J3BD68_9ACTN|nr:hypothetical protein GCM10010124_01960 [Pilimelia terevasa]
MPSRARNQRTEANAHAMELLTIAEFRAELKISKSTYYRWKSLGRVPRTIRVADGSPRHRRRDIEKWLSGFEEAPAR